MATPQPPLEALDLTHVLYDPTSNLALALALATLSPILLMACYGALTLVTRDFLILNMWIGQLGCEVFNYILKHIIKEERPSTLHSVGGTYGFPSSHSQFMGYFASFMLLHLYYRHRFLSFGVPLIDMIWAFLVRLTVVTLALIVCYSRYYLGYHTPAQILWGFGIGIILGVGYYGVSERIPFLYPNSILGRLKRGLLNSPLFTWLRILDSWAVWEDGGHEAKYQSWKKSYQMRKLE